MTLYLLMGALALGAGAWLTRPWWRRSHIDALDRRTANVAAYRTRLAEIEADRAAGLIEGDAAAQLEAELGARLVADAAPDDPRIAPIATLSWGRALAVTGLLAAFGAAFYAGQGSWRTHGQIEVARKDPEAGQALSVDAMVKRLEDRLQGQPEDAEGWTMLGRSYQVLERYADSARAYAKANALTGGQDPDTLVAEGEALGLSRDRDLVGRPQQLFAAALQRSPDHGKALWYAGLAAAQAEDWGTAQQHWTRLRQLPDLPEALVEALDLRLAELAKATGAPPPVAPAPAAVAEAALALDVTVSIGEALAGKPAPGQVLFVFAKAAGGPPMPLAVQRIEGPQLPLRVKLDDSMGMMPQLKLSSFDRWVVTARLGAGGDVKARSGDWEGSVGLAKADAGKPIMVNLDRVVP